MRRTLALLLCLLALSTTGCPCRCAGKRSDDTTAGRPYTSAEDRPG